MVQDFCPLSGQADGPFFRNQTGPFVMIRRIAFPICLMASLLAVPASALSRAGPPAAPPADRAAPAATPQALAEAASACRGVVEDGQSPASAFAPAGLSGPGEAYPGLGQAFFPNVVDLVWFRRTLGTGMIQGVVSASERSCTLFLFGSPGGAAVDQVVAGLAGWRLMKEEAGARIYFRKSPDGATLITAINLGPEAVLPGQIGALIKVYRL
jgi:hypothetical protein